MCCTTLAWALFEEGGWMWVNKYLKLRGRGEFLAILPTSLLWVLRSPLESWIEFPPIIIASILMEV